MRHQPLAAATGLRSGDVARIPELDRLQDGILDEALAVVALGITLPDRDIRRTVKATTFGKYNRPSMPSSRKAAGAPRSTR